MNSETVALEVTSNNVQETNSVEETEEDNETEIEDPILQEVRKMASDYKINILNTETEIEKSEDFVAGKSFSGTAYYISNKGDDSNDGLSPDTAFATLSALEHVSLKYGDAVFFERGSIWRATELPVKIGRINGISYSAYGEGDKPKLYGSEENGSGADKWKLHYSGANGEKIWVYYRNMTEVGAIALNGEIPVRRDIAYWDDGKYFLMDKNSQYFVTSIEYSVEKHLPNMYCFPELEYLDSEDSTWDDDIFVLRDWSKGTAERPLGKLYFRCDDGNPGELYDSVEFLQPYSFATYMGGKDIVLDNLCIAYSCLTTGTGASGWMIQNCEFGWNGGGVCNYKSILEKDYSDAALGLNYGEFGRRGGALSLNNPYSTAINNYVHHSFQEGISVEIFEDDVGASNITIKGNLVEKCNQPIILCNWDAEIDYKHSFKDIVVEDNIVIDTAVDTLYNAKWEYMHSAAFTIQGGPNYHDGTVYVRKNIFAVSEGALIILPQLNDYMKVFSDNTYIQKANAFGIIVGWDSRYSLEKNVEEFLGDKSAKIVLIE